MAIVESSTSSEPTAEQLNIPPKPKPEDFEPPVAWLFGLQFIANLKWILMYAAFKGKLDARDWMKPEIIPPFEDAAKVEEFWRTWNPNWKDSGDGNAESDQEFWFDYISDTGDGQKAMYSIAYLCLSDFAVSQKPELNEQLEFVLDPQHPGTGKTVLPRGTFLFVGGDTSYHISDYGTLANRFQNPFWWAFADLRDKAQSVITAVPRLLFGIPGNHDYYDSIDGFNRQFRRPATDDRILPDDRIPQLMMPTFRRRQEASFLALRLPFDWWFWGLDTEDGEIDFRQLEFFTDLQKKYSPRKLIVATPQPTTAFGKFASEAENQSQTFSALKLERPFLKSGEPMPTGKCRVDLSGDIHHYARYWGPAPASDDAANYTSVMSGGGGAFFHPSHTDVGDVPQQVLYPPADVSRKEVTRQLFKFRNIYDGGYIWLFGMLIALTLTFAASFPQSSHDAFNRFPPWVGLKLAPPTESATPVIFGGMQLEAYVWMASLVASVILLGAALIYSKKLFKKPYDPKGILPRLRIPRDQLRPVWGLVFAGFASLALGLIMFRASETPLTQYGRSLIVLVALVWAVMALIQSVLYSGWLFEEARYENIEKRRYWPVWVLMILGPLALGASLWLFGRQEAAFLISDLVHLLVLLAVALGLPYFAYSTGASLKKGAAKIAFALHGFSMAVMIIAVPFLFVRKGHLIWAPLIALPLIVVAFKYIGRGLANRENGWPLAIAWVLFGAALLVTPFIVHAGLPTPEPLAEILRPSIDMKGVALNLPGDWPGKLLLCVFAAAIGAVMSCVFFGWYLAVSLAFMGHNNEAGGAARIEGFKQLIRFRLTRHGLTGYVIAINKPSTTGGDLDPRLVDVFNVRE